MLHPLVLLCPALNVSPLIERHSICLQSHSTRLTTYFAISSVTLPVIVALLLIISSSETTLMMCGSYLLHSPFNSRRHSFVESIDKSPRITEAGCKIHGLYARGRSALKSR
jgi:hypothetical protein